MPRAIGLLELEPTPRGIHDDSSTFGGACRIHDSCDVLQLVQAAEQKSATAAPAAALPHRIGAAKLIIGDVKTTQSFFESMFGMKEVSHYSSEGVYDEPIMGFDAGARLALFSPLAEAQLKKSQYPVALIYVPSLEPVAKKIEDAKFTLRRLPPSQSALFKIAIATDPSGNAIEIMERAGKPMEVGSAKLIVDDRQKAEDFYAKVFGVKPTIRYKNAAYDEVLMGFGEGAWLALFEPKSEAPLTKSQFPVVAIYTKEFDAVLARIKEIGLGYRDVKTSSPDSRIVIAKDPAGNAVEVIRER
jgi:predicted enzyme related to lactoylglutathione lyase